MASFNTFGFTFSQFGGRGSREVGLFLLKRTEWHGFSVLLSHREPATLPDLADPECSLVGKKSRDARSTPPSSAQFRASPRSPG